MACDPQAVGCWTTGPCCHANGARGTNREDYSHRQRYLVKQSNDVIVTRPGRLASKTPELRRMTRWCKLLVLSTHSSVKSNQHDGSQLSNRRIDRRRAPLRKRPTMELPGVPGHVWLAVLAALCWGATNPFLKSGGSGAYTACWCISAHCNLPCPPHSPPRAGADVFTSIVSLL